MTPLISDIAKQREHVSFKHLINIIKVNEHFTRSCAAHAMQTNIGMYLMLSNSVSPKKMRKKQNSLHTQSQIFPFLFNCQS